MPLDVREFSEAVRSSQSHAERVALIETEVLDREPFAFESNIELYLRIKAHLEKALGSEPGSIYLVGSAAVGFSIAPDNFTRPFHPGSDLDFVVVSPVLFDAVWNVLLRWGHPIRNRIPREAARWFSDRSLEMFWGWLDPERLRFTGATRPLLLKDLQTLKANWFETFRTLGVAFPEIADRDVSARLYRSRMHLLHYQANGLG